MADQGWASTDDHATVPAASDSGGWASTDDHAVDPRISLTPGGPGSWSGFINNLGQSGGRVIGGMVNAAIHPYDTAKALLQTGAGAVENMNPVSRPGQEETDEQRVADAVGHSYKDRYGGWDAIKHTAYTDPFGMAADASVLAAPLEGALRGGAAIADAAGIAPRAANAARTVADIAGLGQTVTNPLSAVGSAAGWGASKAIGALTKVRSGMTPLESAAVDYALNDPVLGGSVDVGTATGNKSIAAQKSILRKFPTSAGVMADAENAQKAAIGNKITQVSGQVPPRTTAQVLSSFQAGKETLDAVKQKLNDYGAQARDAFDNRLFGAAEANPQQVQVGTKPGPSIPNPAANYDPTAPVTIPGASIPVYDIIAGPTDMARVKATATPILDQLKQQMQATQTKVSPVVSMLEDIVNGPDVVSLRTAKGNISTIQDVARNEGGVMRKKAMALASQLVGPLHDAIDDAAQAVGPDAYQALQDGNAATRNKYDLAKSGKATAGSYLTRDVPPTNLAQFHDMLTKDGDAMFPSLQTVITHVPQTVPIIARGVIDNVFRDITEGNGGVSSIQSAADKWNKIGPQTKQVLFGYTGPTMPVAPGDGLYPALQVVQSSSPQVLPHIARAMMDDIFAPVTEGGGVSKVQTAINKLNKIGPQTRELLFGNTAEDMKQLLQYSLMAVNETNTSGTAGTTAVAGLARMLLAHPMMAVAAMTGARALAKGIIDPEMALTVRATGRVPLPSPGLASKIVTAPVANPAYLNAGRMVNNNPYRNPPPGQ